MARYSPSIQNLISSLSKLPGIGGKSAQNIAFHILSMDDAEAAALTDAINTARTSTKRCSCCQNFTDRDPCPICSDPQRDKSTLLVVETPRDVSTFERAREYNGLYHVLHGVFEQGQRLAEDRARDGDVETLEPRSAWSEHDAAVQPEFRPLDHETVQLRRTQPELRTIHPGQIGPLRFDQL